MSLVNSAPQAPDLTGERHEIVLNVRSTIASYALYWHKLAVDSLIFVTTACIALTGFAASLTHSSWRTTAGLIACVFALSWIGAGLSYAIARNTGVHQRILTRLDELNGLFESDLYPGGSIYPEEWRRTGARPLADPVLRFSFGVLVGLPFMLGGLIALLAG